MVRKYTIIWFFLLLMNINVFGEKELVTYQIRNTSTKIIIDGEVNKEEWKSSCIMDLNYEIDPGENIKPPVETKVYLTYDKENLYIAFIAYDPNPKNIRANYCDRDSAYRDDFVGIAIDPFNDERRGYEFLVNPFGVQMDLKRTEGRGEDESWDTIWDSVGKINESGYAVEMKIPFKSISFPISKDVQTWGIWAFRSYPRKFRHQISSTPFDRDVNCFFCQIPKVKGFENIKPGRNLEINPSLVMIRSSSKNEFELPLGDSKTKSQIGMNIRWAPTSNLTVNATINPDFSQVEADSVQLSINRNFSLFYREKRPFFLEEADVFETPMRIVHTRTIADPILGAKFTGKTGAYSYGGFYAEDTVTNYLVPSSTGSYLASWDHSSNAVVLRGKKDIFSNSNIGAIVTSRNGGGYHNTVIGVDGNIYLSKQDAIVFQFLTSDTKNPNVQDNDSFNGEESKGNLYSIEYEHESKNWSWDVAFQKGDKGFRADLGFIGQVDTQSVSGGLHYIIYGKQDAFISKIRPGVFINFEKDSSGNVIGRVVHLQTNLNMAGQSYLGFYYDANMQYYSTENHYYTNYGFWSGARPSAFYSFHFSGHLGQAIDYANNRLGRKRGIGGAFTLHPDKHANLSFEIEQEKFFESDTYLYKADILQGNFVYNFSTRFFVRTIVQYTNIQRNLDLYIEDYYEPTNRYVYSQFLINYKINPRTLCYLGFSTGRSATELYPLQTFNKAVFFKIAYAFRM